MVSAVVGIMVPASLAWACVGLVSLTTSSATVQPGGSVTVLGKEFAQGSPVSIHLDSITGPVLATVPPPVSTMTSQFSAPVTIPADVPVGQHILLATQDYHQMDAGAPARAIIYVGTVAAPSAAPVPRPAGVIANSGTSVGTLVVIAVAVAAVSLLVLGGLMRAAARRRPRPEAVKAP